MKTKLSLLSTLAVVILFTLLPSCAKPPVICFEVVTPVDSIRVGKEVKFSANCSINVNDYYWSFGNGKGDFDKIETSTTYDSIGIYEVTLLSTSGSKSYCGDTYKRSRLKSL
jgi:PKD repeat protein